MSNPLFDFLGLRTDNNSNSTPNPFGAPDQWTLAVGDAKLEVKDADDQKNLTDFLRNNPDLLHALSTRLSGAPIYPPPSVAPAPATPPAPLPVATPVEAPTLLSQSIQRYLTASENRKLGAKSLHERRALTSKIFNFFQARDPQQPVMTHDIDAVSFFTFWDDYTEQLEGKGGGKRSPQTLTTRLKTIGGFFAHCVERRSLASNPVAGMARTLQELQKAGKDGKESYRAFSIDEVKRIFRMPDYGWNAARGDYFWAPIIANLGGMRLGEIVQLRPQDLFFDERSRRYVFKIQKATDKSEARTSVKNRNSKRVVPVHKDLVALGFLEYVSAVSDSGFTRLFPFDAPGKTYDRNPTKNPARRFGEYLTKIGITDPQAVSHSFRHTVAVKLHQQHVPVYDAMSLLGHGLQDDAAMLGLKDWKVAKNSAHGDYTNLNGPVADDYGLTEKLGAYIDEHLSLQVPLDTLFAPAQRALSSLSKANPYWRKSVDASE